MVGFHNGWFSQITGACFHSDRECNERGEDAVPQREILKRIISILSFYSLSHFLPVSGGLRRQVLDMRWQKL
jgi:hypothetical protein